MKRQVLVSLIVLGTIMVLLASMGSVHATVAGAIKEHHPASTFTDPSGFYDGYLVGQTITFHIHVNVTNTVGGPWLSISNLNVTDTLPNLAAGTPTGQFMTYVAGSQNSSSATGPAAFTDFANGTFLWSFGPGPFTTGVLAPPPFSNANDLYQASITFNATILGTVPDKTYLVNQAIVSYAETVSGAVSRPGVSDTIWVLNPPNNVVPQVPVLGTAGAAMAMALGFGVYIKKSKRKPAA